MTEGYSLQEGTLVIHRKLTELDIFVRDFLEILKMHSDYLIVSGYVSISTGRVRGTEDVDVLVPVNSNENMINMFQDFLRKGFWCYQSDEPKEIASLFLSMSHVRFARSGEMFPNMEVIPITSDRHAKYFEFTHPLPIRIENFEFKIPWIEFEITYKEKVLAGKKDLEDAMHLRTFFDAILDEEKFRQSEEVVKYEIQ